MRQTLQAKRLKSIVDMLEEVDVLMDTHFSTEFGGMKSPSFLEKVIAHQCN